MTASSILVTGSHRSGTTWVGRMLTLSGETGYLHEPFNPRRVPGWAGQRIPYWFLYVTEENEHHYAEVVRDVLAFRYPALSNLRHALSPRGAALYGPDLLRSVRYRMRGPRPLMKDPIALFSAEWLADRFDAQVVVMIRHPAAFVSSIARLGWHFRFRSWLAQEALLRDKLEPFRAAMHRCWAGEGDVIEQGIVMWNAIHHVIDRYRSEHPEWSFLRHEDLAAEPVEGFRELYARLGLTWSDEVESAIREHSEGTTAETRRHGAVKRDSAATVDLWKSRLDPAEIDRIRDGTAEIASRFYPDPPSSLSGASL